jgi:hypothetical protein
MGRLCTIMILAFCLGPRAYSASDTLEPKQPVEWFARAADLMNLRTLDAAPFHLRVRFRAFPGDQMLPDPDKGDIVTGDGVYEETWLGLHQWRREITLGSYHAVEVEGNGVRKFQASSDYEPSRVLMLIRAIDEPLPRALTSREFHASSGWKIDHITISDLNLVRLSKTTGSQRADYTTSYYFYPQGMLALENNLGMVTSRSRFITFGSKFVPQSLAIHGAAGDRDLLNADIEIERPGPSDLSQFDLPGSPADPGMTLRPLDYTQVRLPDLSGYYAWQSNTTGPAMVLSVTGGLDRRGRWREVEVLLAPNPRDAGMFMQRIREDHKKPATIDSSPCEFVMNWIVL